MKIRYYLFVLICSIFTIGSSQLTLGQTQNVGINDNGATPDPSAMLDVNSSNKGMLIPRVSSTSVVSNPATGLIVYQKSDNTYYYYNGTAWVKFGGGGGGGTLNDAYNFGGAGAGSNITANAGPGINSSACFNFRRVSCSGYNSENQNGIGLEAQFMGTTGTAGAAIIANDLVSAGNAISATDDGNGDNTYATVQVSTSSNQFSETKNLMGGIESATTGNAPAILAGVVPTATATTGIYSVILSGNTTATSAVYGNNLRLNGGAGLSGEGVHGVSGNGWEWAAGDTASGVIGTGYGAPCYGVAGQTSLDGVTVDHNGIGIYSRNNMYAKGMIEANTDIQGDNDVIAGADVISYGRVVAQQDVYAGVDFTTGGYVASVEGKQFRIDNPSDPANKYLIHFSIESPEVLNVYRGNIMLDANGEGTVNLPAYFSEINNDFSYNLTPVGAAAPGLYVKTEVKGNTFAIGGGKPNMKVSWTLYAQRNDLLYRQNPQLRENAALQSRKGQRKISKT